MRRIAHRLADIAAALFLVAGALGVFLTPLLLLAIPGSAWLGWRLAALRGRVFAAPVPHTFPLIAGMALLLPALLVLLSLVPWDASDNSWLGLVVPMASVIALALYFTVVSALPTATPRDAGTLGAILLFAVAGTLVLLYLGYGALSVDVEDAAGTPLRSRVQVAFVLYGLGYAAVWWLVHRVTSNQRGAPKW